ncbi:hypothetical protein EDI_026440 [Entamoeba dispar SAW760]|uniref:TLDc domain-containing protein n=1 Tax=Entamoeba dispar (strain ATCC PRA-260 / SAW760) TaxID=370354 RepID=B0EPU3_ENTDS|nr:uncharacterized protein EDI_026440 [Entamoeba dispar SAW760]EDR23412.1 hypothetical protein EDI_026440 [Entamoeba dispar SAW760]|eukprot:EDR23412.1 hypothetical protein EDI_026440 [Entamoeba dispar SAW760]
MTETEKTLNLLAQTLNELKKEVREMNNKIYQVEESIETLTVEMRRNQVVNGTSRKFYEEFLNVLKKWTGLEHFDIVFEYAVDGYDRTKIYNQIDNKEHVMIIVQDSHNNIFGCYQNTKAVLDVNENDSYGAYTQAKPDDFFVFSLNNNHQPEPQIARKKETGYAIKMYPIDNRSWILGAHCCFYIGSKDNSFISPKVKDQFSVPADFVASSFNDTVYPNTFSLANMVILHWN